MSPDCQLARFIGPSWPAGRACHSADLMWAECGGHQRAGGRATTTTTTKMNDDLHSVARSCGCCCCRRRRRCEKCEMRSALPAKEEARARPSSICTQVTLLTRQRPQQQQQQQRATSLLAISSPANESSNTTTMRPLSLHLCSCAPAESAAKLANNRPDLTQLSVRSSRLDWTNGRKAKACSCA